MIEVVIYYEVSSGSGNIYDEPTIIPINTYVFPDIKTMECSKSFKIYIVSLMTDSRLLRIALKIDGIPIFAGRIHKFYAIFKKGCDKDKYVLLRKKGVPYGVANKVMSYLPTINYQFSKRSNKKKSKKIKKSKRK